MSVFFIASSNAPRNTQDWHGDASQPLDHVGVAALSLFVGLIYWLDSGGYYDLETLKATYPSAMIEDHQL